MWKMLRRFHYLPTLPWIFFVKCAHLSCGFDEAQSRLFREVMMLLLIIHPQLLHQLEAVHVSGTWASDLTFSAQYSHCEMGETPKFNSKSIEQKRHFYSFGYISSRFTWHGVSKLLTHCVSLEQGEQKCFSWKCLRFSVWCHCLFNLKK